MKKRFFIIALILALLGSAPIALASNISGARYYGLIHIQNDSTATTNVATTCNISTQNLIDGDYLNASANNCVIKTSAGADMPFMPAVNATNPWCLWVASIGTGASQTDILYTANSTGGEIRYFPDTEGMTTADNETLELGDNFTIEQRGWVDTSPYGEDFTTYTEVDALNKLTVTRSKAEGADVDRDEDVYLYKDMGANYFDALDIDFEIYIASTSIDDAWSGIGIANTVGSIKDFVATDLSVVMNRVAGPTYRVTLLRGAALANDFYVGLADTPYYCTLWREAGNNSANVTIYSDEARITLLDTLILAGWGATKYQYIYGFVNFNDAGAGGRNWDGYVQNLDLTGEGKSLVYKQGAFQTYISAAENITSAMSGANVTATGISSGERKVVTTADTANLTISVYDANDVLISSNSTALTANVTDNNAIWTYYKNMGGYWEYTKISINGTLKQHIVWEYDTTFHDLSGNNDATPTFRTASSDADVSAELVSFQPVAEAKAPDYILGAAPPFIDVGITGNVTGTFTTTPGAGTFPLAGIIIAVANATRTPPQLPLLIIAVFIILAASLTVSASLRQYGSGSLLVKIIVIVAFMGIFIALGNFAIDFWMLVVFLIIGVAIAFMSKQVGWT